MPRNLVPQRACANSNCGTMSTSEESVHGATCVDRGRGWWGQAFGRGDGGEACPGWHLHRIETLHRRRGVEHSAQRVARRPPRIDLAQDVLEALTREVHVIRRLQSLEHHPVSDARSVRNPFLLHLAHLQTPTSLPRIQRAEPQTHGLVGVESHRDGPRPERLTEALGDVLTDLRQLAVAEFADQPTCTAPHLIAPLRLGTFRCGLRKSTQRQGCAPMAFDALERLNERVLGNVDAPTAERNTKGLRDSSCAPLSSQGLRAAAPWHNGSAKLSTLTTPSRPRREVANGMRSGRSNDDTASSDKNHSASSAMVTAP
eukprot:3765814-Prymnesium_polylepis.2